MCRFEIRFLVEAKEEPYKGNVMRVIEKGLKEYQARVVSMVETMRCPICGQPAEVTTTFASDRRRWWEFWKSGWDLPRYRFDSEHPCYKESVEKYADAESPWRRVV